jgi:hypothetical protein
LGNLSIAGSGASSAAPNLDTGSGVVGIIATGASTQAHDISGASGSTAPPIAGTGSGIQQSDTSSGAGHIGAQSYPVDPNFYVQIPARAVCVSCLKHDFYVAGPHRDFFVQSPGRMFCVTAPSRSFFVQCK